MLDKICPTLKFCLSSHNLVGIKITVSAFVKQTIQVNPELDVCTSSSLSIFFVT